MSVYFYRRCINMKKGIKIVALFAMLCSFCVIALPKAEVSAKSTYEMNYDELVEFWSQTDYFYQVYLAEVDKACYIYDVKADLRRYFKASLSDYVNFPWEIQAARPITYNFMADVMSKSNPEIYYTIKNQNVAYSLPEMLLDEINGQAPYLSHEDKMENVSILIGFLHDQGVYNVDQYKAWKANNGGRTAFEVYLQHVKDASDAWEKQITDQYIQMQQQRDQEVKDAYEAHEQWKQDIVQQGYAAQQAQLEALGISW